jgi:hypothetical protein
MAVAITEDLWLSGLLQSYLEHSDFSAYQQKHHVTICPHTNFNKLETNGIYPKYNL